MATNGYEPKTVANRFKSLAAMVAKSQTVEDFDVNKWFVKDGYKGLNEIM